MAKIILYIAVSLDMKIARPDGAIDWLFTEGDYGYQEFLSGISCTIMGNKTYQEILGFDIPFPYPEQRNFVLTKNKKEPAEFVEFIHEVTPEWIERLRQEEKGDIWLIGGGEINSIFLRLNQIDEMHLFVHPVFLGNGIPLHALPYPETWFKIKEARVFDNGLVQLSYTRK